MILTNEMIVFFLWRSEKPCETADVFVVFSQSWWQIWHGDTIPFRTLFPALLEIPERVLQGLAFSTFIRIWVPFEMVELTQSKECKSQEKTVKLW